MIRKKQGEIEWLEFELFANKPIKHAVFLRKGGVSLDSFHSLNTIFETGDDPQNVEENLKRIQSALNIETLISSYNVHGTHIELINEAKNMVPDCDGLMTQQKNWGLLVNHADCQATIFYDPAHHALAIVHAGWKGQADKIYHKTIDKMGQAFGTRPEDLLVAISPSLGPKNSEFINYRVELPEEFWHFQVKPTYFDLWAISHHQLEECGVAAHHIEIAEIDTYAHPEDFFSYRREKAKGRLEKITGCHATVAALFPQ